MIKAVFWDFGGVFTTSPFEAFRRFERDNDLPQDFIRQVNSRNPDTNAWARFERNEVDVETFDQLFQEETKKLGYPVAGSAILPLLSGDLRPEVVRAFDRVRDHFITACLTNNVAAGHGTGMSTKPQLAQAIEEVMQNFDLVLESSKTNVRKPEPEFYRMACERLDVSPEEVVYLDDLGINLKPARAMGMTTIKVTAAEPALAELSRHLELELT